MVKIMAPPQTIRAHATTCATANNPRTCNQPARLQPARANANNPRSTLYRNQPVASAAHPLQYLLQSCSVSRGVRGIVEDMCYEIRRAEVLLMITAAPFTMFFAWGEGDGGCVL
jgi:hypothetical protein